MKLQRAVGIDLGTTNSVAASMNEAGHTEILRDSEGNLLVPSVVLFDDERTIVGEEARLRGRSRPQRLAACAKRELGRHFYSQPIEGVRLPPEVIQGCILNKLRHDMEVTRGLDFGAVIAVPAHFNELKRRLTAEAAEMAGLHLLDLINEPVAAVLAWGEHTPLMSIAGLPIGGFRILVYNLGGYSFEATLLDIQPQVFTTLATHCASHLGGHDWDLRVVDYLAEQFIRQHGVDPRENPVKLDQLLAAAVRAKHALGVRHQATVALHDGDLKCEVRLTRAVLEDLTRDLLQRTAEICDGLVAGAGLTWNDVSQVLLVGGATQMPMVQQLVAQRTGRPPYQGINPSEAIARGAAIYAHELLRSGAGVDGGGRFRIGNVSTHSLGIESNDPQTGKKVNKIIIRRGTPLPTKVTKDFAFKSSKQKAITIRVLEGESPDPEKCVTLGLIDLHSLPAELNDEWPVEVTYAYSSSGLLQVDARLRYTDRVVHLELARVGTMSQVHLQRWKDAVLGAGGFRGYREIALAERREQLAPGIVAAAPSVEAVEAQTGVLSFLKRYMPFAFTREKSLAVEESLTAEASVDGQTGGE